MPLHIIYPSSWPQSSQATKLKHPIKRKPSTCMSFYRLLSSSVIVFCHELLEIIEQEINETCSTLYISDFNIHMDTPHHLDTIISMTSLKASIWDIWSQRQPTNLSTPAIWSSQVSCQTSCLNQKWPHVVRPQFHPLWSQHGKTYEERGPNHSLWSQENGPTKFEGGPTSSM